MLIKIFHSFLNRSFRAIKLLQWESRKFTDRRVIKYMHLQYATMYESIFYLVCIYYMI